MTEAEILEQVRQMRERGSAPKQIARALGLRPAQVAPLIRQVSEASQAQADPADRALLGCWISPGWSVGLGLEGEAVQWGAADPLRTEEQVTTGGLAQALIVRRERASRVTVCGFLVDTYCLGVKACTGPETMAAGSVDDYRRSFFEAFDAPEVPAPLELVQHLVHGGVAYARGLGFEPRDDDFETVRPYLGTPEGPTPITFGRDGQPFFFAGPHDDHRAVRATLDSTVGAGNYHFLAPA
ncbi:hypothetical protein [Actinoplanes solisilvae]|uniref:hypothetical protein n=1 Tax=Actinoplanes solisilvae TaxID=2486853 RepID=UPI0013E4062B|nr:hypothetical protein [Actinoplanes solisilvae]